MNATTRNGIIFILISSMGYAGFPIFTKFIYQYSDLTQFDLVIWRFGLAIPLMWLGAYAWERALKSPPLERPLPRLRLMFTGVFVALAALAGFFGLQYMDAGLYVVLFYTYPMMVAIISALLGEPLPLKGWVALALTMIGVLFTVPNITGIRPGDASFIGFVIAMGNALVVALFVIVQSRLLWGYPSSTYSTAWSMTGVLLVIVPVLLFNGVKLPPSFLVLMLLFGLSVVGTVIAYFFLILGIRALGPSRASITGTTEPIFVLMLDWVLLGSVMGRLQIVGALLIIASVVILEARFDRKPAAEPGTSATPSA